MNGPIRLICVGRLKESFYRDGVKHYSNLLGRRGIKLEIIEIPDEKAPEKYTDAQRRSVLDKEGASILRKITAEDIVCALDIKGMALDRQKADVFAGATRKTFIIGGSLGLGENVLNRANYRFSFSRMTFPHQLMRLILMDWMLSIND